MTDNKEEIILELYQDLDSLGLDEKKMIHYKSVSNIIYHLINKQKINSKKNSKLQELGEKRMKDLLIEFLKSVKEKAPTNTQDSLDVYKKYIVPIGNFMGRYYSFSNFAGKSIVTYFFLIITIAAILGFVSILIFKSRLIYVTLFSLIILYSTIKILFKYRTKRIYGFLY